MPPHRSARLPSGTGPPGLDGTPAGRSSDPSSNARGKYAISLGIHEIPHQHPGADGAHSVIARGGSGVPVEPTSLAPADPEAPIEPEARAGYRDRVPRADSGGVGVAHEHQCPTCRLVYTCDDPKCLKPVKSPCREHLGYYYWRDTPNEDSEPESPEEEDEHEL